jgi:cytochrome b pre-mRNA-processing protein 3
VAAGRRLYLWVVEQARTPALYRDMGAPDTLEGRFELYTLHLILLLRRLRGEGPQAKETSQALFDAYLQALDDTYRELGVGDLSMAKKMRKLGEAVYGRMKSYDAALDLLPDTTELGAVAARTVFDGVAQADVDALCQYVSAWTAALAASPIDMFLDGRAPETLETATS